MNPDFNSFKEFYDVAFVTPDSINILESLMQNIKMKIPIREFLNECWCNSQRVITNEQLKFELGEFGDKTYYAICEKNRVKNKQPWCLNLITTDDKDFMSLKRFAWLGNEADFLKDVEDLALDEKWTYKGLPCSIEKNNILKKYLDVTFSFLYEHRKDYNGITYSKDKNYCGFNTGLVDKIYDDIYIIFQKQLPKSPEWKYICCTTKRMTNGKRYLDLFPKLPQRANYAKISELFLIPGKVESDFEHIFADNFDRFPINFIQRELSPEDSFVEFSKKNKDPEELKKFIIGNEDCIRRISSAFEKTVEQAIRRWKWNYKTAVPMYFPTLKKIQFLLPLYFSGKSNNLEAALVIDKTARQEEYRGVTILTPAMAYLDARLLCRPDSDWLFIDDSNNSLGSGNNSKEINDFKADEENLYSLIKEAYETLKQNPFHNNTEGLVNIGDVKLWLQKNGIKYNLSDYNCTKWCDFFLNSSEYLVKNLADEGKVPVYCFKPL